MRDDKSNPCRDLEVKSSETDDRNLYSADGVMIDVQNGASASNIKRDESSMYAGKYIKISMAVCVISSTIQNQKPRV